MTNERDMAISLDQERFFASLTQAMPPRGLPDLLLALWHDARGDWAKAHAIVQGHETLDAARVHAYLHRKEGDAANAQYWYRRCGQEPAVCMLAEEWRNLVAQLLDQCFGGHCKGQGE